MSEWLVALCSRSGATTVTCPLDPPDPAPPAPPFGPVDFVQLDLNNGTDSFTNQNLLASVFESDSGALRPVARFRFPRQDGGERLSIADYFRSVDSGEVEERPPLLFYRGGYRKIASS